MIRRTLLALAIALTCGTAAGAQNSAGLETMVKLRGFQQKIRLDTVVIWRELSGSPADAYSSAKHFLDSLKIKIHVADSVRGVIYADFHIPARQIAGHPRSWTVHCGADISGDIADVWRLSLAYVVYIQPGKEGGTRLGTGVMGGADPVEGVSKAAMPCPSTGNFEQLLFKAVQLRVL